MVQRECKAGWFTLVLFLLLTSALPPFSLADSVAPGVSIISTDELQRKLEAGDDMTLIHVMPKIAHDSKHIPGSVNIPVGQIETSPDMPREKDRLLVFYCMGVS